MTTGFVLFILVLAVINAVFPIVGSVVMKAEGDGGSNGGGDGGGWDFSNDDLPF